MATRRLCVNGGTAALIKLDAILCIKCHHNDDDAVNNQWHLAPIFTPAGIVIIRYVEGTNIIIANRSNDQFVVNKHDIMTRIRNTTRHDYEVSLADSWITAASQTNDGDRTLRLSIKNTRDEILHVEMNRFNVVDELNTPSSATTAFHERTKR